MEEFLHQLELVKQSWWTIIFASLIAIIWAIRVYVSGQQCPSKSRMDDKIVVITGGSGGIALATAKELGKRGATVILGIRNAKKGRDAVNSIKDYCAHANVIAKLLDVSDFTSIREFVNQITLELGRIDVLINNAGIIFHPYQKTVDGNELTMSTNYFGPFLLTHLSLPLLNKSENGRVINLSSLAHFGAKLNLDELNSEKGYHDHVFAQSKLALTIFTKQMAALLKYTRITVNAVDPGLVRGTGHLRKSKLTTSLTTKLMVWPWMWLFLKTPTQGCQTVVYAAVESALSNVSGCYLNNCELQDPAQVVLDTELADKLYAKTCEIVGIDSNAILKDIVQECDNK